MNKGLGGIYGLAFIGAAVYYIQHSATFWAAILMYKLLEFLKI